VAELFGPDDPEWNDDPDWDEADAEPAGPPWWQRKWVWAVAAVILFAGIAFLAAGGSDAKNSAAPTTTSVTKYTAGAPTTDPITGATIDAGTIVAETPTSTPEDTTSTTPGASTSSGTTTAAPRTTTAKPSTSKPPSSTSTTDNAPFGNKLGERCRTEGDTQTRPSGLLGLGREVWAVCRSTSSGLRWQSP
jgi:hypothetical protein